MVLAMDSCLPWRMPCPLPRQPLLNTPLNDLHVELGARMVPFAGYSMPVQFGRPGWQSTCTRNAAGLFDVSHYGPVAPGRPRTQPSP
jgi:aminomethyltransferase